MKYILIDDCGRDIFTKEFENAQEAIEEGNRDFDYLTEYDKKRRNAFYLLESVNEDPEAEDHFDGDVLKSWYRAVYVNTETMERRLLYIAVNGNKEEGYTNMDRVFHEATYNMKKNEIIEKINLCSVRTL